ncbi:MAG: hypothetical protein NT001_02305 [Candidatus Woesearchaeota archaeon]|nr:hypothetical protein [Candidatus Woesearchaeota archaeon]
MGDNKMIDMTVLRNALDVEGGDIDFGEGIKMMVIPVGELNLDSLLKDGALPVEEVLKLVDGSKSDIQPDYIGQMDKYLTEFMKLMVWNAHNLEEKPKELKNGEVAKKTDKYGTFVVRTNDPKITEYSIIKWFLMTQAVKNASMMQRVNAISTLPELYPARDIARSFPYDAHDFIIACGAGANGNGYKACDTNPCANNIQGMTCIGVNMDLGNKIPKDRRIRYSITHSFKK